jgi:hypothetical protein
MNIHSCTKITLLGISASLFTPGSLLAQTSSNYQGASSGGGFGSLVSLVICILTIVGLWKVFVKAGQPGWASIIPIYNAYIICKIVGKPGWWVILLFIPLVNIIIAIILVLGLAKSFGQSALFGIGMLLLGFVFIPILGFGAATYKGPSA